MITTGSGYVLVDFFRLGGILHFSHSMGPRDKKNWVLFLVAWGGTLQLIKIFVQSAEAEKETAEMGTISDLNPKD